MDADADEVDIVAGAGAGAGDAGTYYVASDGDDANTGTTKGDPFKTYV